MTNYFDLVDDYILKKILTMATGDLLPYKTKMSLSHVCSRWRNIFIHPYYICCMCWDIKPYIFATNAMLFSSDVKICDIPSDAYITFGFSGKADVIEKFPEIYNELLKNKYIIKELDLQSGCHILCQEVIDFVTSRLSQIETLAIDMSDKLTIKLLDTIANNPYCKIRRLIIDIDGLNPDTHNRNNWNDVSRLINIIPTVTNITFLCNYYPQDRENVNIINHRIKEIHFMKRAYTEKGYISKEALLYLGKSFPNIQRLIISRRVNTYIEHNISPYSRENTCVSTVHYEQYFPKLKIKLSESDGNFYTTIDSKYIGIL